jgi:hypothetical protein
MCWREQYFYYFIQPHKRIDHGKILILFKKTYSFFFFFPFFFESRTRTRVVAREQTHPTQNAGHCYRKKGPIL